ncbi:MAG: hypothetical protein K0A94_02030 [Desulfuromonadales bacterium]|nr:hypothetical protein [Desulfuromonadales bacterium]
MFVTLQRRIFGSYDTRDAIVSRWVIHDRLLSPSMTTNTLATGAKGPAQGQC